MSTRPTPRPFPHIKRPTDAQRAAEHADAIWLDVRSTYYGPAELRRHRPVHGRPAWRFPYYDRVYVAHRPQRRRPHREQWVVSLWLAPFADEDSGLPRNAATAAVIHVTEHGPLVTGAATLKDAVRGLALTLMGSQCDHGYHRGRDSCPGCDVMDDLYDDLT